jgi:hypothetical protein
MTFYFGFAPEELGNSSRKKGLIKLGRTTGGTGHFLTDS